jgi:hypothetical protein
LNLFVKYVFFFDSAYHPKKTAQRYALGRKKRKRSR